MATQLWLPLGVAAIGFTATLLNGVLVVRSATRLAARARELDRWEADRLRYLESCRQYLRAAQAVRSADAAAEVAQMRAAAVDIGLYNPGLAGGSVAETLRAAEQLAGTRGDGAPSESVEEARAAFDRALGVTRAEIAADLALATGKSEAPKPRRRFRR